MTEETQVYTIEAKTKEEALALAKKLNDENRNTLTASLEKSTVEKPENLKNRNTLTVVTEKSTETKPEKTEPHIYQKIFQWAVCLSNEQEFNDIRYLPQPSWLQLVKRLELTQGNLIKVVGAQGIGKTTLCNWLLKSLISNGQKAAMRRLQKGEQLGEYEKIKYKEYERDEQGKPFSYITTEKEWEWDYGLVQTLLIDLWDYSKTDQREIVKSLDAIQEWWQHRYVEYSRYKKCLPNIVIFLQKESLPLHFFLGKMEYFELKPWRAEQLAEYYHFAFETYEPFTKEALVEIGVLSQGVFRKFKEYISACMNEWFVSSGKDFKTMSINIQDVRRIITADKIVRDMDLQLSEIWQRSKEKRYTSVKVLGFLREHGKTTQQNIEEIFFPS